MGLKASRARHRAKPRAWSTHGRRPAAPRASAASILAAIAADPGHVAAALCQMATLAHVAGRLQKRNDSVDVAADLLAYPERRPKGRRRSFAGGRLVC
ncbi:MAG TPA: hypothetical protein VN962_04605 [Polyangia bacterium]|jgi:hypothetical protein|nr:hypothetical protein [Polyangia bacterium]HXU60957.1 hypothetical protein [Polyangia bacterium]